MSFDASPEAIARLDAARARLDAARARLDEASARYDRGEIDRAALDAVIREASDELWTSRGTARRTARGVESR